ncbi:MAG: Holliday junction resolvase RuvX [Verrucomicrobia bacterium]|nr:Holliday junction resolvase RuvX [Verrucomicrobiota bacterium]
MSRILGIDFGTVRIGLALSDSTGILASPLPFLENKSPKQVASALAELVKTHEIERLIVGLPRNMDGSYGPSAQRVREFITHIQIQLTAPIETIDERLTTAQASKELSGFGLSQKELRKKVDSSSACLILQQFLDRRQLLP